MKCRKKPRLDTDISIFLGKFRVDIDTEVCKTHDVCSTGVERIHLKGYFRFWLLCKMKRRGRASEVVRRIPKTGLFVAEFQSWRAYPGVTVRIVAVRTLPSCVRSSRIRNHQACEARSRHEPNTSHTGRLRPLSVHEAIRHAKLFFTCCKIY